MSTTTAPLRVALVIGGLGYGGAERQLTELVLGTPKRDVAFHVFSLGGDEEPYGPLLRSRGVAVTTVSRLGGFDLRRSLSLASHLRRQSFDLVHSFLIDANPYAFVAARWARIPAFIASNRNAEFPRDRIRAAIDGWVFRRASVVLVNARAVAAFTARSFGIPEDRFCVIHNGVDVARFHPPVGVKVGGPTIGTVGSLHPKKNPELFGEVAAAVSERVPAVRCLHLGDGPMRVELERRFGNVVQFLGASSAVGEFLRDLDVFVLTSNREGCPNVLLEAMACGRAVIATDAGGVTEVLRDGDSGYVVKLGDRDAIVERIYALLRDAATRNRLGSAARRDAENRFAVSKMVEKTVGLYRSAVARSSARARA